MYYCKYIAFSLLVLLMFIMGVATFVGNSHGIDYALQTIYYKWWFAALWVIMVVTGLVWLCTTRPLNSRENLKRNAHLWFLHGSLAVILLGACVSFLTSWSGSIHLRLGDSTNLYADDEHEGQDGRLPFTVTLKDFELQTHYGTEMASNYVSVINVLNNREIGSADYSVSMNRVPVVDGVRFYQASYDSDGRGSTLLVRYDRWGQSITYTGYALLLIAFLWSIFTPNGGMRRAQQALKRMDAATKKAICLLALLLLPTVAFAQYNDAPRALPKEVASEFGKLYVSYGGRICPFQTLAQDFCRKVYGRPSWHSYTAEQVVTGWLFWPDDWNNAAIIKVKSHTLRSEFDLPSNATWNDFFLSDGYRLGPLLSGGQNLSEAAADVDDRLMLIYSLRRGELFTLFPVRTASHDRIVWISPVERDSTVRFHSSSDSAYVRDVFTFMSQDAVTGNFPRVVHGIASIAAFQHAYGAETLPSEQMTKAERLYNAANLPIWLYRINLTLGLLLFIAVLVPCIRLKYIVLPSAVLGALGLVALTIYIGLRSYVSGRLPLGNGFETMLAVAWFVMVAGALLWRKARRLPMLYGVPFLASGFFLLVASLSQSNAEITQLQPVLNSPLLSLHVSIIMLSYALLSVTFLISVAGLCRPAEAERARLQSLVVLYPAVVLLAVGIFLGAVWANVSWGRYWGWDPKEVWALITLLVYVLPLHSQSLSQLRRPLAYHIYIALAFATVLMTYFGVNYYLTGLHSYAG